jgi:spore coat protein U-like protein
MKATLAAFAAALCALLASHATARCELELKNLGAVVLHASRGNDYDPFDASQYVVLEEFELEHDGEACAFFVTFSASEHGSYERTMRHDGATLRYQIYDSVNLQSVLKDLPQASANEVLAGSFERGKQRRRLRYAIAVPPNQYVPHGNYSERITVAAYEGTLSNHTRRDSRSVRISTRIREAIQISLVPAGGTFDPARRTHFLHLGTLAEGKTGQVDLLVRNNTRYRIFFESANRGELRQVLSSGSGSVPYQLHVRGVPISLRERPEEFPGSGALSTREGDRYPIVITVGTLERAEAGLYHDHITITVKAH